MIDETVKVKVYFVESDGEVVAVMPYVLGTNNSRTMACYVHTGQHSTCHADWVLEQAPANESEYGDLLNELKTIGYDVEILTKFDYRETLKKRIELFVKNFREESEK